MQTECNYCISTCDKVLDYKYGKIMRQLYRRCLVETRTKLLSTTMAIALCNTMTAVDKSKVAHSLIYNYGNTSVHRVVHGEQQRMNLSKLLVYNYGICQYGYCRLECPPNSGKNANLQLWHLHNIDACTLECRHEQRQICNLHDYSSQSSSLCTQSRVQQNITICQSTTNA